MRRRITIPPSSPPRHAAHRGPPGAIATMILLSNKAEGIAGQFAVQGVMLLVLGCVLALFFMASGIERALGRTGTLVVTRLLGMLLAALASNS